MATLRTCCKVIGAQVPVLDVVQCVAVCGIRGALTLQLEHDHATAGRQVPQTGRKVLKLDKQSSPHKQVIHTNGCQRTLPAGMRTFMPCCAQQSLLSWHGQHADNMAAAARAHRECQPLSSAWLSHANWGCTVSILHWKQNLVLPVLQTSSLGKALLGTSWGAWSAWCVLTKPLHCVSCTRTCRGLLLAG